MIRKSIAIPILLFMLYILIADISFAFRHPEMTDTQRILHFVDIIKFK